MGQPALQDGDQAKSEACFDAPAADQQVEQTPSGGPGPSGGKSQLQNQMAQRSPSAGAQQGPATKPGAKVPTAHPQIEKYRQVRPEFVETGRELSAIFRELQNWEKTYGTLLTVNSQLLAQGSRGTSKEKIETLRSSTESLGLAISTVSAVAGPVLNLWSAVDKKGDALDPSLITSVVKRADELGTIRFKSKAMSWMAFNSVNLGDDRITSIGKARVARADMLESIAEVVGDVSKDLAKRIVETWIKVHAPWAKEAAPAIFEGTWAALEKGAADLLDGKSLDPNAIAQAAVLAALLEMVDQLVDLLVTSGMEAKMGPLADMEDGAKFTFANFKSQVKSFVTEFVKLTIEGDMGIEQAVVAAANKSMSGKAILKRLIWFGVDKKLGVSLEGFVDMDLLLDT